MAVYIIKTDKRFEEDMQEWLDKKGEDYCAYTREEAFRKAMFYVIDSCGGAISVMKISEDEE